MKLIPWTVVWGVLVLGVVDGPRAWGQLNRPKAALSGRDLFHHSFHAKDSQSPFGDGVGPVHNATSCVACHSQGGPGGAGPNEANVDLLTPIVRETPNGDARRARETLNQLHPAFAAGASTVMLHRQGISSEYAAWRLEMLGYQVPPENDAARRARMWAAIARKERTAPPIEDIKIKGVTLRLSHRSTPALFGAGLIDAIPDEVIEQQAKRQAAEGSAVSGRVPRANPELRNPFLPPNDPDNATLTGIGRFGWRGQTSSLREFVLGACANELGLEVPNHEQGRDPLDAKYRSPGLDLDRTLCEKLIEFVRQLPRPQQIVPPDPDVAALVKLGSRAFQNVGCAACHVPDLGNVQALYSDLLLHDMGPELADPIPANPERVVVGQRLASFGYFGSTAFDVFATVPSPVRQEWRTPPLWGVADSPPYLHDGRAKTLEMAIALHGGEAAASRDAFRNLTGEEQKMLLAFLKTLRAPGNNNRVARRP